MTGPVTLLADLLSDQPPVKWLIAKVDSIQAAEKSVTLDFHGGLITNISYLDSYVPVVGDVVHCLSDQRNGLAILGREVPRPPSPPDPAPVVTLVAPTGSGTYDAELDTWSAGVRQGPNEAGAYFYDSAAFVPLVGKVWGSFEIELTLTPDSQAVSMLLHDNADTSAAFIPASALFLRTVPLEVVTWVSLPLGWANQIIDGVASGVGFTSDIYSAVVSSGGTLRFTTL